MDEIAIRKKLCDILGVAVDASDSTIRKAYMDLAKRWHPDRVQHNPELAAIAEQRLKDINQAYECLTNRAQFLQYAEKLVKKYPDAGSTSGSTTASGKKASGSFEWEAHGSFSDAKKNTATGTKGGGKTGKGSDGADSTIFTAPGKTVPIIDLRQAKQFFLLFIAIVIILAGLQETADRRKRAQTESNIVVPRAFEAPGASPYSVPSTPWPTAPSNNSASPPPGWRP